MIAQMVREMILRGVDVDVICLAVETAERALTGAEFPRNSTESAEEKRKRKDRDRKRNSTENPRNSKEIPNVPLSSSNLNRKKGERLSESWELSADDLAFVLALGWSEAQALEEASNFRDYWIAQPGARACKLDWRATWRKWARSSRVKPAAKLSLVRPADRCWDDAASSWVRFRRWPKGYGNDPDSPACECPRDILEKHGIQRGAA